MTDITNAKKLHTFRPWDLIFPGALLISALSAFIATSRLSPESRNIQLISEIVLGRVLVTNVGLFGIIAFLLHTFRGEATARDLGWPSGNPFQKETAVADLAMGVLGILCLIIGGEFWTATVIFASIYFTGATITHLIDLVVKKNFAPLNAGFLLFYEGIMPLVLIGLVIFKNL